MATKRHLGIRLTGISRGANSLGAKLIVVGLRGEMVPRSRQLQSGAELRLSWNPVPAVEVLMEIERIEAMTPGSGELTVRVDGTLYTLVEGDSLQLIDDIWTHKRAADAPAPQPSRAAQALGRRAAAVSAAYEEMAAAAPSTFFMV